MNIRQEFLISYDMSDTKDRTSLYNILLGYGLFPIQKSVFWGRITKAEKNAISRCLQDYIKDGDKAFILPINVKHKDSNTHLFGYAEDDFVDWKNNDVI